jgi:hypothetical protein
VPARDFYDRTPYATVVHVVADGKDPANFTIQLLPTEWRDAGLATMAVDHIRGLLDANVHGAYFVPDFQASEKVGPIRCCSTGSASG